MPRRSDRLAGRVPEEQTGEPSATRQSRERPNRRRNRRSNRNTAADGSTSTLPNVTLFDSAADRGNTTRAPVIVADPNAFVPGSAAGPWNSSQQHDTNFTTPMFTAAQLVALSQAHPQYYLTTGYPQTTVAAPLYTQGVHGPADQPDLSTFSPQGFPHDARYEQEHDQYGDAVTPAETSWDSEPVYNEQERADDLLEIDGQLNNLYRGLPDTQQ